MFAKPTVFVLGAGASYECGFPLGSELVSRIATTLDVNTASTERLLPFLFEKYGTENRDAMERAADHLRAVLKSSPSTDDALNWLSDDPVAIELGKIAIAAEILIAERTSDLANVSALEKFDSTWAHAFFSLAKRDLKRENVEHIFATTTVINFNYDRSLEHYLATAFVQRGPFAPDQARKLVESLNVIRPYGSLGNLWGNNSVPFGGTEDLDLKGIAKNILTFTEQRSADVSERMMQAISNARVVIFLGFGFHRQNVSALTVESASPDREVYGTTLGINHQISGQIREYIAKAVKPSPGRVYFHPVGAAKFLADFELPILTSAN
ncbi:hypothetical protein [Bradyrhizobium sp. McL0615]|uniref:hypothetical protein n=1 Tax=Bradyrhizobium sp. McL0615 TaxID=3415673 RepID=UPI003CE97E0B